MITNSRLHVGRQGQSIGEFSTEEITRGMAEGRFSRMDVAWQQGMPAWVPLGQLFPQYQRSAATKAAPQLRMSKRARIITACSLAAVVGIMVWGALSLQRKIANAERLFTGLNETESDLNASPILPLEARKEHTLTPNPKYADRFPKLNLPEPPADKFSVIKYKTANLGEMTALVSTNLGEAEKRNLPAVVWVSDNLDGLDSSLWESGGGLANASPLQLVESGLVVLAPSFRGQHDNPGEPELWLGEVDDLLDAVEHAKGLPGVDPERVYLVGAGTGATHVMLAAAVGGDRFRAAFALGGNCDAKYHLIYGVTRSPLPYESKPRSVHNLRSPLSFATHLKQPVILFETEQAEEFDKIMPELVTFFDDLPGTEGQRIQPLLKVVASSIGDDSLEEVAGKKPFVFENDQSEIFSILTRSLPDSLEATLTKWLAGNEPADALQKSIEVAEEQLGENISIEDEEVVALVHKAFHKLVANDSASAASVAMVWKMYELADESNLGDAKKLLPPLSKWITNRLDNLPMEKNETSHDRRSALFDGLELLTYSEDKEQADIVIAAARHEKACQWLVWRGIFYSYEEEHELTDYMLEQLSKPILSKAAGVGLLHMANQAKLNKAKAPHPFDSDEGMSKLQRILKREDAVVGEDFDAALALAFISPERRKGLLDLALQHPKASVRLEGAWADARNKGQKGIDVLTKATLDPKTSITAISYLEEVGQEAAVPAAAREPKFAAEASMWEWLMHPNELGEAPATLEMVDHRELYWPPSAKKVPVSLFRFTWEQEDGEKPDAPAKVVTSYGMTGGMTWSFLNDEPTPPTHAELYLKHCTLELNRNSKMERVAEDAKLRKAALEALRKGNPEEPLFKELSLE